MADIVDINKAQLNSPICKIQRPGKKSPRCCVIATKNIEPKTVIWFEVGAVYSGVSMMDEPEYCSILPNWCQNQIECSIIQKMIPFINQTDWMLVYQIIVKIQDDKRFDFEHLFPLTMNQDVIDMSSTDWMICRMLAKTFSMEVLFVATIHQRVKINAFPLFPKNCPRFVVGHALFPFTSFFQRSTTGTSNSQLCVELGYESDFPSLTVISQKHIKKGEEIIISCQLFNVISKPLSPSQKFGTLPKDVHQLLSITNDSSSLGSNSLMLKSLITIFNEQCFIYGSKFNPNFSNQEMIKMCSLIESKLELPRSIRGCLILWRTKKVQPKNSAPNALADLCNLMDKLYSNDLTKHDLLESYIITHCVLCHNLVSDVQKDQKALFCYTILCSPAFIAAWALKQYSVLMAKHSTLFKIAK